VRPTRRIRSDHLGGNHQGAFTSRNRTPRYQPGPRRRRTTRAARPPARGTSRAPPDQRPGRTGLLDQHDRPPKGVDGRGMEMKTRVRPTIAHRSPTFTVSPTTPRRRRRAISRGRRVRGRRRLVDESQGQRTYQGRQTGCSDAERRRGGHATWCPSLDPKDRAVAETRESKRPIILSLGPTR
jgi:hypothetical protein